MDFSTLPDRINSLLHQDEKILYASRPSLSSCIAVMLFSLIGNLPIMGALFAAGGLIAMSGTIITVAISLTICYYSWKNKYYVITDSRTIISQGIFNVAIKIILNSNVQLISINTGIIDRYLKLNSIELATSAQGGGASFFPGMKKGCVTLKYVDVKGVIKNYAQF